MSPRSFNILLEKLRSTIESPPVQEGLRGPMPAELRLAMTLRYLAGASYLDVAPIYGCADTNV